MIDGKGNKISSLPFSFSKNYMAKKSKNVGKTIGLIFLGLTIIGALAGSGVQNGYKSVVSHPERHTSDDAPLRLV